MNSGTISIIVGAVFLVCLAIGFFRGFFKGAVKSAIDTLLGVLSVALAFPITRIIMGALVNSKVLSYVATEVMNALPSEASTYVDAIKGYMAGEETGKLVSETLELIAALPTILIAPLIFLAVLSILALVLFGMGFFIKMFISSKKQKIGWRLFGGALGAFTYILILTAFIIPLNGYVDMVNDTAVHALEVVEANKLPEDKNGNESTVKGTEIYSGDEVGVTNTSSVEELDKESGVENGNEQNPNEESEATFVPSNGLELDLSPIKPTLELIIEYTSISKDSPALSVISSFGGKKIFNSLTTVKTESADICLEKEVGGLIDLCDVALKFVNANPEQYGMAQAEATRELNEILSSSDYLPELVSRAISFTAGELYAGRDLFGLEKPNLGEEFNPMLDNTLRILKDTDANDLRGDLTTVTSIASEFIESEIINMISSEEVVDVYEIMDNRELLETIFVELYKNSRTRNLIPYITSYVTDYIYTLYDDINDKTTEVPSFDYDSYNEERMYMEAAYIKDAMIEIQKFVNTIDITDNELDPKQIIMEGDFASLGKGLENMRDSIFTERIFKIVVYAVLHSELAEKLAIVDASLVENATADDADLVTMLVSRQNIMKLAISIQEMENRDQTNMLIESVIESLLSEDTGALTAIVSKDNLELMGMSSQEAESIESIVGSMVNGASGFEFESEEEKKEEIKKTEEIIFAIGNTVLDEDREHHHMFDQGDGDGSTTEMTAQDFVSQIVDSKLTSSMIQSAVTDENGDAVENPYKIQGEISNDDIEQLKNALNNSYTQNGTTDEQKETLEALASIFGVTLN